MVKRNSRSTNWTSDAIIAQLQAWARKNGRSPRYREWVNEFTDPSASVIQRKFGGWSGALKAAGLEVHVNRAPKSSSPLVVSPPSAEPLSDFAETSTRSHNDLWDTVFATLEEIVKREVAEQVQVELRARLDAMKEALSA